MAEANPNVAILLQLISDEVDPNVVVNRDMGRFFSVRQQLDKAALYYNLALEGKNDDPVVLYSRSVCYSAIAEAKNGLIDARKAMNLQPDSLNVNLQYCDSWFVGNEFERSLNELFTSSMKFSTQKQKSFQYRTDIIEEVLSDCLGDGFRIFANENWKILPIAFDIIKKETIIDERPQYKKLKELGKCDVVSVLEEEVKLLHPREVKRRRVCYESVIQTYFKKSATDVLFLESLLTNPSYALKQTPKNNKHLLAQAHHKFERVYRFMKMMQSRSPIYSERLKKSPSMRIAADIRNTYLLTITHKTRNVMFRFVEKVNKLRKEKKVKQLAYEIEEWMTNFVDLKTDRIFQRKLEFMHHIYNTLGLAYLDQLQVPDNILDFKARERVQILFKIVKIRDPADILYVFGDKSTFTIPDKIDYEYIAYKQGITKLKTRYKLAKFNIEKIYLLHAIAMRHADKGKFKDLYDVAVKLGIEAKTYNTPLWLFLSEILKCHSNAGLYRIEKLKEDLQSAYKVAVSLFNDPRINNFLQKCIQFNNIVINEKTLRRSQFSFISKPR